MKSFFSSTSSASSMIYDLDQLFDNETRIEMIEEQLLSRGFRAEKVIQSMLDIPRHRFIPNKFTYSSYSDLPIPLGYCRTVYQPYIIALMMEAADVQPHERILEIGTGCGYTTALLSRYTPKQLISIDDIEEFIDDSIYLLQSLGIGESDSVSVLALPDISQGFPSAAPYDAIIVNPPIYMPFPTSLFDQLSINGRLIAPIIQENGVETLSRFTRTGDESWIEETIFEQRNPVNYHFHNSQENDD